MNDMSALKNTQTKTKQSVPALIKFWENGAEQPKVCSLIAYWESFSEKVSAERTKSIDTKTLPKPISIINRWPPLKANSNQEKTYINFENNNMCTNNIVDLKVLIENISTPKKTISPIEKEKTDSEKMAMQIKLYKLQKEAEKECEKDLQLASHNAKNAREHATKKTIEQLNFEIEERKKSEHNNVIKNKKHNASKNLSSNLLIKEKSQKTNCVAVKTQKITKYAQNQILVKVMGRRGGKVTFMLPLSHKNVTYEEKDIFE